VLPVDCVVATEFKADAEAKVVPVDEVPEDLQGLDESLSDTYFCNFSIFQSIPDSWAIKQLFPIIPIHRLAERPTKHAVLGDITCDSDGKVDQFIDRRDVRHTLRLHAFDGSPYYLGVFLVGAYQEILGDLHNLLGDTHAVHVSLDAKGAVVLDAVIKGDTVREVLDYVQFDTEALVAKLRSDVETALRGGSLNYEESGRLLRFYEDGRLSEALGAFNEVLASSGSDRASSYFAAECAARLAPTDGVVTQARA
jgi:arginine decarboxylase